MNVSDDFHRIRKHKETASRTINQTESMRPLRELILPLIHLSLLELKNICCDDRYYPPTVYLFTQRNLLFRLPDSAALSRPTERGRYFSLFSLCFSCCFLLPFLSSWFSFFLFSLLLIWINTPRGKNNKFCCATM